MKSRVPINLYVWLSISIIFSTWLLLEGMSIIGVIIYGVMGPLIIYMLANTRDCRIPIIEDKLFVNYLRPFFNQEEYDLKDVNYIHFEKANFLNALSATIVDAYIITKDKLILVGDTENQVILINTRRADILKIIKTFNDDHGIEVTDFSAYLKVLK